MNLDYVVDSHDVLDTTTDIITAYVVRNKVSVDDLCHTIGNVYSKVFDISRSNRALTYKELLNNGEGVLIDDQGDVYP